MSDVELVGVVDPLASARDSVAADCHAAAFADHRELIGRIDAAVIATPTRFHCGVALEFLEACTPLLVEKPLALDLAEAEAIVSAAEANATWCKSATSSGSTRPSRPRRPYLPSRSYIDAVRASGFTGRSTDIGVVHDLMIHDIDLVLSLVESPLVRIAAVGTAVLGRHEDVAQARLEFADGAVANLCASRVSYAAQPKRRMHLWSDDGFAAIDFGNRTAQVVRAQRPGARWELRLQRAFRRREEHLQGTAVSRHSFVGVA